jgi:predicted lipid carrier protein YhbT
MTSTPAFALPKLLRVVVSRLPAMPPTIACAAVLSAFARCMLRRSEVAELEGTTFRIAVEDAGLAFAFRVQAGHVEPLPARREVDVTFTACAADLLSMAMRREDPDTLFFVRRLSIVGDTGAAHRLKNILDAVELPPWVTHVARRYP